MNREEARQAINSQPLTNFIHLEKSRSGMYCCPVCGSGTGPRKSGALKLYPDNRVCCYSSGCQLGDKGQDTLGALRIIWNCSETEAFERAGIDMDAAVRSSERGPVTGHDVCIACGACADVCPEESRVRMVSVMDADDVIREVMNHRLFYSYSGGGVTFSGGEATSQPEFLDYVSRELYDSGISTDIESCGFFDFDSVRPALERMDLIFMDLKHMDPDVHKKYTGVSNERILENIARLGTLGRPEGETGEGPQIVIRIPVIGGVNNSEENIAASAAYVHEVLPSARMELLPYHKLGRIKYEAAGIPFTQDEFYTPDKEEMKRLRAVAAAQGPEIADYR